MEEKSLVTRDSTLVSSVYVAYICTVSVLRHKAQVRIGAGKAIWLAVRPVYR